MHISARFLAHGLLPCMAALLPLAAGAAGNVIPPAGSVPVIDGRLDDAVWKQALVLDGFTVTGGLERAEHPAAVRLVFDRGNLYLGFRCGTPYPGKIRKASESGGLWQDDCIEIFLRSAPDAATYDQLLVNAAGLLDARRLASGNVETNMAGAFKSAAAVTAAGWEAEVALPLTSLGFTAPPEAGDMLEMKFGREDYTASNSPALSVWPARSIYGGAADMVPLYFAGINRIQDGDFMLKGAGEGWLVNPARSVAAARGDGAVELRLAGPAAVLKQPVRVKRGGVCRLECQFMGVAAGTITVSPAGGASAAIRRITLGPGAEWKNCSLDFASGAADEWWVAVELFGQPGDWVRFRNLQLKTIPRFGVRGDAIPVPLDIPAAYVIRQVPVADCHALPGGGGLHVKLADRVGVNAVQIRGGVMAEMRRDCTADGRPESGVTVYRFPGQAEISLAYSGQLLKTDQLDFFNIRDGYIADLSFFRCDMAGASLGDPLRLMPVASGQAAHAGTLFPGRILQGSNVVFSTQPAGGSGAAPVTLSLQRDAAVHLVLGPFGAETGVAALGLEGLARADMELVNVTVELHDSACPRTCITAATFALSGSGRLNLALDMPDRNLPPGRSWVATLRADGPATISTPAVVVYRSPPGPAE
jgi:hypothetical protein